MGADGRTVLFSSHILEEVEQVSGTVQVIVAGPAGRLRRLPHDPPADDQPTARFTIRSSDDRRLAARSSRTRRRSRSVELRDGGLTVRAGDYGASPARCRG